MSVNAVDQTTGNTTPLSGNTNNLVGNLSALTTNTKSDAVGAINEVNQTKQNATDNNLQTTDKTIVGGINELRSGLTGVTNVDISAITLETGITWNTSKSSYLKKRCGQLYGNLFFNGLLDMSASSFKKIGVISSPYIPIVDSRMPVYLQTDSDIVIAVLAVFAVTGNIFVIAPKGNYGKSNGTGANSWCTSDGVYVNMLV